jgi:hypothetical protein
VRARDKLSELRDAATEGRQGDGEGAGARGASPAHDGGLYPGAGASGRGRGQALAATRAARGARGQGQAD